MEVLCIIYKNQCFSGMKKLKIDIYIYMGMLHELARGTYLLGRAHQAHGTTEAAEEVAGVKDVRTEVHVARVGHARRVGRGRPVLAVLAYILNRRGTGNLAGGGQEDAAR